MGGFPLANPRGPATAARTQTQGQRQRNKPSKTSLRPSHKKWVNNYLRGKPKAVRDAFNAGLDGIDLRVLTGLILSEFTDIQILLQDGSLDVRTATVNKARLIDYLRRVASELHDGPALPDTVTITLETPDNLKIATDVPEPE